MKEYLGQESVRAWLIISAIFAAIAVLGLAAEWDGLTRSGIIGGSTALIAGLAAITANILRFERR